MRIVTLILLLVAPTIALGKALFKGTVTDSSDTPISAAMVLIHWTRLGAR